jgi:Fe-S cluster assembly ATP-binding protein
VSRRVEQLTQDEGLGVLAITHYSRLLHELHPDVVHVLSGGRIVATGGPELAQELERTGYAAYGGVDEPAAADESAAAADPFADPLL